MSLFKSQIIEGENLYNRLIESANATKRSDSFESIPKKTVVTIKEMDSWMHTSFELIVLAFGEYSKEVNDWKNIWDEEREDYRRLINKYPSSPPLSEAFIHDAMYTKSRINYLKLFDNKYDIQKGVYDKSDKINVNITGGNVDIGNISQGSHNNLSSTSRKR